MPTPPQQSYIIWFSQRVGSTVLAQTLEDTGIAGRPREWLYDEIGAGLLAKHAVSNALELRETLWRHATTANGVFAVKHGMHAETHREVTALLGGVLSDAERGDERKAWEAFFPRCKHVFMTRRDKLRLAVSWWRAIKTQQWHRPTRHAPPTPPAADLMDRYDYDAIDHLLTEACLREADLQALFTRWGVIPYTIVYEDFIARYDDTVRELLTFLEIPGREGIAIPAPALAQLADEISEAWCQRYRREWEAKAG
jgi:LPS sulfotransferase NodH